MKTRKQSRPIKRHPNCGLLLSDFRKQGIEIQTWGLDATNSLVYAGVHYVPQINSKNLYRLHTHWARWRKWYDNLPENKHDYPAKHSLPVAFTGAHPIDAPKQITWLRI